MQEEKPPAFAESEGMDRIIKQSEDKKEKDNRYFVRGTLIIMAILLASAVILWAIFLR